LTKYEFSAQPILRVLGLNKLTCRDAETGEFYHRILQPIPLADLISLTVEVSYTIYYNCICTTFNLGLKNAT